MLYPLQIGHLFVHRQQSLYYNTTDLVFYYRNIRPHFFHLPKQTPQRPLMSNIVFSEILIVDKCRVALIYGVVCEMHASIAVVGLIGWLVGGCSQTGQALFVYVYGKRL